MAQDEEKYIYDSAILSWAWVGCARWKLGRAGPQKMTEFKVEKLICNKIWEVYNAIKISC
jgi:hypothetical protein